MLLEEDKPLNYKTLSNPSLATPNVRNQGTQGQFGLQMGLEFRFGFGFEFEFGFKIGERKYIIKYINNQ